MKPDLLLKNSTLQTILNRRSIRFFQDKEVSAEDLETILTAANMAPSAHNQQSWKFILLRGDKKNELVKLVTDKAPLFARPSAALLRMAARSIASAPIVIAVANTGELIHRGPTLFETQKDQAADFFRIMEIQSSAAAVENMLLAATSLGLSSVWLGILILIQKSVLEFLNMPQGEFMAVVPVGYALKQSAGPKKKDLELLVTEL